MPRHTMQLCDCQGRPVQIAAGWDHPLQGFFFDIENLDEPEVIDDEDNTNRIRYDNLRDCEISHYPGAHLPTFDYFERKAASLGVVLPAEFINRVKADAPEHHRVSH